MRFGFLLIALLLYVDTAAAAEVVFVPSDARATHTVLSMTRLNNGLVRVLNRRDGLSGTTFTRREVNCRLNQVRNLGSAETMAELARARPDQRFAPLVSGSIADVISRHACARAGPTRASNAAQSAAASSGLTRAALPQPRRVTSSSNCACGSGRVCVGPRGGRYCISRSGSRRYGV